MLKTVSSITNAIGALNYKGTWNASTNTPTIVSSTGVKGDYYVVSVGGTTTIDGISNWGVGDWITYNGSVWQRVEGGADLNGVNLSVSGTTTLSALTASKGVFTDASKILTSTGILGSDQGGTANGFTKFSGPTTSEKTFTLPDASATIDYLARAGNVLQVVQGLSTTQTSNVTNVYADTNLSASITPSVATNKVLVIVSQYHRIVGSVNDINADIGVVDLLRGASSIFETDDLLGVQAACPSGNVILYHWYNTIVYLDSPSTTSSTTYKTQMKLRLTGGARQIYSQFQSKPSTITLLEIAA